MSKDNYQTNKYTPYNFQTKEMTNLKKIIYIKFSQFKARQES